MSDFDLIIDSRDVVQAGQNLLKMGDNAESMAKSAQSSASAFVAGFTRIEKQIDLVNKANKEYSRSAQKMYADILKVDKASKSAADSASVFERGLRKQEDATRKQTIADQKLAREKDRLLSKYSPLYASSMQYQRAIEEITSAQIQGILTDQQALASKARVNREYQQFADGNADWSNQFVKGSNRAGRSMNRLGMYAQQVGYQVGDFFVQVQSGQSAMIAFAQQGTQLAGLLPGIAGAVIGISLALGGMIYQMLRARREAEELDEDIRSLTEVISGLDSIQTAVAVNIERNLNKAFRDSAGAVGDLLSKINEVEFKATMAPLIDELDDLSAGVDRVDAAIETVVGFDRLIEQGQKLSVVQKSVYEDARNLVQENLLLSISVGDVSKALDQIGQSQSTKELIENLANAKEELELMGGPVAEAAVQALIDLAVEAGVADSIVNELEGASNRLSSGLSDAKNEALSLRDALNSVDLAGLEQAGQIAVLRAKIATASRYAAGSVTQDAEIARTEAQARVAQELGSEGASIDVIAARSQAAGEQAFEIATLGSQLSNLTTAPPAGRSSSGGGASGPSLEDQAKSARDAIDQLIASYDEQYSMGLKVAEAEEKVAEALRLGVIPEGTTAAQIMDQFRQSLEDNKSPMDDFVNNSAKQVADAFTDIVSGAKSAGDAFSNMARTIVEEAFKMAVVNPIINSLFGGVGGFKPLPSFFADGAAFNKGKVTAYANGGVVSSPTLFPMANGAGLMGEAGPEAIMPLKRGKNGKLGVQTEGGGQTVVVHQNFNFSANGDDSVKRIIMQSAPSIAQMTKKTILDDRRRGGTMKRTFG